MPKKQSEYQRARQEEKRAARKKAAKADRRRRRRRKALLILLCCVLGAAAVVGISIWGYQTSPLMHLLRVIQTEHYSLNAAELSFYSWQIYQEYMDSADDSTDTPDTSSPLSEQNYDDDTTWEEYFTSAGQNYGERILTFCEAATAAGYTPDEDPAARAQESLSSFDDTTLPRGVKDADVLHALELFFLATSYSDYAEGQVEITEDELETYYSENTTAMQVASYICFGFSYDDTADSLNTRDNQMENARELRRCATREAFEAWVTNYYHENYTSMTDADITENLDSLYMENAAYIADDIISEWAFSGESSVGESEILTDEENSAIYVCLMLSEPERDTSFPANLRQVLFTTDTYGSLDDARNQAEAILEAWQDNGDTSEESFAALANYYSEDNTTGGLYQDVSQGQLPSDWKAWVFDESRQAGDVTILDSSYGACIVYFVSLEDTPAWEVIATNAVEEEKYDELYAGYEEQANPRRNGLFAHLIAVRS